METFKCQQVLGGSRGGDEEKVGLWLRGMGREARPPWGAWFGLWPYDKEPIVTGLGEGHGEQREQQVHWPWGGEDQHAGGHGAPGEDGAVSEAPCGRQLSQNWWCFVHEQEINSRCAEAPKCWCLFVMAVSAMLTSTVWIMVCSSEKTWSKCGNSKAGKWSQLSPRQRESMQELKGCSSGPAALCSSKSEPEALSCCTVNSKGSVTRST